MKRMLLLTAVFAGVAHGAVPEPVALRPGEDVRDGDRVAAIYRYPAPAEKNTGFTVIVCPGGGYRMLCDTYEGHEVAEWFNSIGVNAVVLRYRLPKKGFPHPAPLQDLQRAIRLVRREGVATGSLPDRIGVMGFSAGGHLAAMSTVHYDAGDPAAADPVERQSCRPDFSVLCYPVIRGDDHGTNYPDVDVHVTSDTPPAFIYQCTTDEKVAPEHALAYYAACRKAGVSAEMHVFRDGLHGGGMALADPLPRRAWSGLLAGWIRSLDPVEHARTHPAPLETERWQREIDAASSSGGGRVVVPAGRHRVGGLFLKDNVELHLEEGAVLEGSSDPKDYRHHRLPGSGMDWFAVVTALGATNVAVTGKGTVFGNGGAWPQPEIWGGQQEERRPHGLLFNACRDVRLEDFTLRDAACWGIFLRECEGVTARRVKVDSHANINNDGFDIEARDVLIEDCVVDADDDAYCFKSDNPDFVVENVTIRNCIGRSNCNVYKFGTGTRGTIRNVLIERSSAGAARRSFISEGAGEWMPPRGTEWYWSRKVRPWVGCADRLAAISGVAVECVDGGVVRDITVRDMELLGVMTPLFVRGGTRNRAGRGEPTLENIVFERIRAEAESFIASSITGVTGCRPRGIVLRDISLVCRGAGDSTAERTRPVPEQSANYPEANMFDCMLPAYGLYLRHADDVRLENVRIVLREGTTDARDPIVSEDVNGLVCADGTVRPDHAWVWRRSGKSGDAPFDGKSIELRHGDAQDWSLNCFRRMKVRAGDRFAFSFASESLSDRKGPITASAVTRRADGEVSSWYFAPVTAPAGKSGRTEFVVPPGVDSVEPRFTGEGPVDARLSGISFEPLGNILGDAVPTKPVTVEGTRLSLTVSHVDGGLSVTDRKTGRTWTPADVPGQTVCLVRRLEATADGVTAELVNPANLSSFTAEYRLADAEIALTLTPRGACERYGTAVLDYPAAFAARKGDRLVVPMNEGIGFPVDERPTWGLWREGMYSGHGLCMAFFGVVEDATGAGWMALVETPDDAAMAARPDRAGMLAAGPSWDACRKAFGYARRMRYVFFDAGGHVAMAKRYRAYAKEKGLLVTFAEKARTRPRVTDICGAPNLWITGCKDEEGLAVVDAFHRAGWTNLLWSSGGSPAFVKRLAGMKGMLVGRYDIYQDIMDPKHRDELNWWHPDWVTEAFPHDIMWKGPSPEEWTHGWPVESKQGPRIDCAVLCDRQAPPYARARIGAELKVKPYNVRFIDTTTASPWRECWNPAHPMTRGESREWKMRLLNVVSGEFGLVCGSETGHDAAVPYCDYFEGMLSLGPYRVDEAGRNMWQVVDEVPERLAKYQVGEAYRLPLWELVYHDCCVAQWYWGDYNNKLPKVWRKRDLFNALYATPPMYLMHSYRWPKLRDQVLESMKTACPASLATAGAEMTDHRFLSADRSIQQTVFSNGVKVTVDFARDTVRIDGRN